MSYDDRRQPWITQGILISLASLFEICKGIKVEFKGYGDYKTTKTDQGPVAGSVPGMKAQSTGIDSEGKKIFIADADFFESCIREIQCTNVELKAAIGYLSDFKGRISVSNLLKRLIYYKQYPEASRAISDAGIQDSIKEFTFDFQEIIELSSLLLVSYRNRTSHSKLRDGRDKAFHVYHHATMSRFLQLVENCSEYSKSKEWWTSAPLSDGEDKPLAMINNHEEAFRSDTEVVFDFLKNGPPLHKLPSKSDTSHDDCHALQQPDISSSNGGVTSLSKADLYEIVDIIRETHDESGSHFAWLEEQLSLLVADKAEDIKNSLLRPWMNKDIEAILSLMSSQSARQARFGDPSDSAVGGAKISVIDIADNQSLILDRHAHQELAIETDSIERRAQKIYTRLRFLRNEIRDKLHLINPRFEYYHCVLQSNIVWPALRLGVCSYDQLKETKEFQIRIVKVNRSFMLDTQEELYKERIDQLLSENPF